MCSNALQKEARISVVAHQAPQSPGPGPLTSARATLTSCSAVLGTPAAPSAWDILLN